MAEDNHINQLKESLLEVANESLNPQTLSNIQYFLKQKPYYLTNKFEVLKSFRVFFLKYFKDNNNDYVLIAGCNFFNAVLKKDVCLRSYAFIQLAFLQEYLGKSTEADASILNAWKESDQKDFLLSWVTDFYSHIIEKKIINAEKRAEIMLDSIYAIDQEFESRIELEKKYLKCWNELIKIKNDNEFVNKILNETNYISEVENLLQEYESFVNKSQRKIEIEMLDWFIKKDIAKAEYEAVEKRKYEIANRITFIRLKCVELIIQSKGDTNPENLINYLVLIELLSDAEKHRFKKEQKANHYYNNYEFYLNKAVELGEKWINDNTNENKVWMKYIADLGSSYYLLSLHYLTNQLAKEGQEKLSKAIKNFKKLNDNIYTSDINVQKKFIAALNILGQYDEAEEEYQKIVTKSVDHKKTQFSIIYYLGITYESLGLYSKAEEYYLQSLILENEAPFVYSQLVKINELKDKLGAAIEWQKKIIDLPKVKESEEGRNWQTFKLALLLQDNGESENAIKIYKEILDDEKRQPNHPEALDRISTLLMLVERYDEALFYWNRKINAGYHTAWIYCQIGDCYLKKNEKEEAKEWYLKARDKWSYEYSPLQRLAQYYEKEEKGKFDEAIELVNTLIKLAEVKKEDQSGLYKWLGDLHLKNQRIPDAIEAYNQSLQYQFNEEVVSRIKGLSGTPQEPIGKLKSLKEKYEAYPKTDLANNIIDLCIQLRQKDFINFSKELLTLGKTNYDDVNKKLIWAQIYELEGDFKEALKCRKEIDKISEADEEIKIKNITSILKLLEDTLKIELGYNDYINCLQKFVREKFLLGENSESEQVDKLIRRYKDELHFLARHYNRIRKNREAKKYIDILLSCDDRVVKFDKVYLQKKADIYSSQDLKKYKDAKEALRVILDYEKNDTYALTKFAEICREEEKFDEAISYLIEAFDFIKNNGKESELIVIADQIGYTYRLWSRKIEDEQEKKEKKLEAIKWYEDFRSEYKPDLQILYGLSKAYSLEPCSKDDLRKSIAILKEALINNIELIARNEAKEIDGKILTGLIRAWDNGEDNFIEKMLRDKYKRLREYRPNISISIITRIIKVAKEDNRFSSKIVSTITNVMRFTHNRDIRAECNRFFMKRLIDETYKETDLEKLRKIALETLNSIFQNSEKQQLTEDLKNFLGSEKRWHFISFNNRIAQELHNISKLISEIDENNSENVVRDVRKARELMNELNNKLSQYQLLAVGFENINISEKLKSKEDRYRLALRENNFILKIKPKFNFNINANLWKQVDDLIFFEIIDSIKNIDASLELVLLPKNKLSITININEDDTTCNMISREIVNSLKKINRVINFNYTSKKSSLIIILSLNEANVLNYPKLYTHLTTNFFKRNSAAYWGEINNLIKNEIQLNDPKLKEKLLNFLLILFNEYLNKSKSLISIFLHPLHELWNQIDAGSIDIKERYDDIIDLKNRFQTFSQVYKHRMGQNIYTTELKMEQVIRMTLEEYKYFGEDEYYSLEIKPGTNSTSFKGFEEDIQAIIGNLLHNSRKFIKEKQKDNPKLKPKITIQIEKVPLDSSRYKIIYSDNGTGIPDGIEMNDLLAKGRVGLRIISWLCEWYIGKFDIVRNGMNNNGANFLLELESL